MGDKNDASASDEHALKVEKHILSRVYELAKGQKYWPTAFAVHVADIDSFIHKDGTRDYTLIITDGHEESVAALAINSLVKMLKDATITLGCTIAVRQYGFRAVMEGGQVCDMLVIASASLVRGPDFPICNLSNKFAALAVEPAASAGGSRAGGGEGGERKVRKGEDTGDIGSEAVQPAEPRKSAGKTTLSSTCKPVITILAASEGRPASPRYEPTTQAPVANPATTGSGARQGTIASQLMERVRHFGRSRPANTLEVPASSKPNTSSTTLTRAGQPTAILPRKK